MNYPRNYKREGKYLVYWDGTGWYKVRLLTKEELESE